RSIRKSASSWYRSAGSLSMTIHSSARSMPSSHQNVLATGPATCAHAASLAATAPEASSIASARESVVVCTCRNCTSPPATPRSPAIPEDSTPAATVPFAFRPLRRFRVPRPFCLIVNPQAGNGRARALLPVVTEVLTKGGTEHRVIESASLAHAKDLAAEAAGRG